jgi:hypothetical protein
MMSTQSVFWSQIVGCNIIATNPDKNAFDIDVFNTLIDTHIRLEHWWH